MLSSFGSIGPPPCLSSIAQGGGPCIPISVGRVLSSNSGQQESGPQAVASELRRANWRREASEVLTVRDSKRVNERSFCKVVQARGRCRSGWGWSASTRGSHCWRQSGQRASRRSSNHAPTEGLSSGRTHRNTVPIEGTSAAAGILATEFVVPANSARQTSTTRDKWRRKRHRNGGSQENVPCSGQRNR